MTQAPKNYKRAGELHLRKAESTGDKYYSGSITVKVGSQVVTVPVTIYANKAKVNQNAPDAFIFVHENQRSTIIERDENTPPPQDMDDIPF